MTLTLSDVVYKYDVDTDIVTKHLTKALLSILLKLSYYLICFSIIFFINFFFLKKKSKYECFLISIHLKVLLGMPLLWFTHLLFDYDLTQDELLTLFDY